VDCEGLNEFGVDIKSPYLKIEFRVLVGKMTEYFNSETSDFYVLGTGELSCKYCDWLDEGGIRVG